MRNLSEECLGILNKGLFTITDPGPLHQPIRGFSIRRDDKLRLIVEIEADPGATSSAVGHPPGTVRMTTERVQLKSVGGLDGELSGVIPYSTKTHGSGASEQWLKEEASVHIAATRNPARMEPVRVIDWLENLPQSPFVWPAGTRVVTNTTTTRTIALDDGITICSDSEAYRFSSNTAKLTVGRFTFYVCALDPEDGSGIKPGCIIYDGLPDDGFRKKVRVALSFALGIYLVELGSTQYDAEWGIVSTLARSAYTLGRHAFELHVLPPAPLGPRFQHELNPAQLTRAVTAFVDTFDSLDLANLHWAYWHACAATPHIAPAHFGAAIEALQAAYLKANPDLVKSAWAPREEWKALRAAMTTTIESADISAEAKAALSEKLSTFNGIDQRQKLKALMAALNLHLGDDEDAAWRRRNKAAHGTPIPEGQELAAIRDMKLLRGLFQRLLLRVTNAAPQYIDYASPHHEYRSLADAPPDAPAP
jgi:hypothetical protein